MRNHALSLRLNGSHDIIEGDHDGQVDPTELSSAVHCKSPQLTSECHLHKCINHL